LRGLDRIPNGLVFTQPIDLFERIRQVLGRGQASTKSKGNFNRVILTGGSCWWPFMVPLVTEVLGVTESQILMSQNPEATIGEGLALYHVLKLQNDTRREHINGHKPQAKIDFEKAVAARLDRYADEVSTALVDVLMPCVEKAYWDWYNNGGSLNQVEEQVRTICKEFEKNEAQATVKRYWVPLNADLVRLMRDHLAKFLTENEIPKSASNYIPKSVTSIDELQPGSEGTGGRIVTEVGDMAAAVTAITTLALLILAAVKVKVVGAVFLAAVHNTLLAAGLGLAALIASYRAGQQVKEVIENAIKSHEFNVVTRRLLYVALRKKSFRTKLSKGRDKAKQQLCDAIRNSTREIDEESASNLPKSQTPKKPIEQHTLETFDHIIDVVIKDLGVLEQFRPETTRTS
jgi:hypothetical protein